MASFVNSGLEERTQFNKNRQRVIGSPVTAMSGSSTSKSSGVILMDSISPSDENSLFVNDFVDAVRKNISNRKNK